MLRSRSRLDRSLFKKVERLEGPDLLLSKCLQQHFLRGKTLLNIPETPLRRLLQLTGAGGCAKQQKGDASERCRWAHRVHDLENR